MIFFIGLGFAGVVAVGLTVRLAVMIHPAFKADQQMLLLPAQFVLYALLYGVLWTIMRVRYGQPLWRSLGWLRSRVPAVLALLGGCALSVLIGLLGRGLGTPRIPSPFDKFMTSPAWMVLFGVFAVALGPFTEEFVFRGFLQPLLARDLGTPAGILLTAALFGLLHGPEYSGAWQYVALIAVAGAAFGVVRAWGRSVIPAAFMHAGFNAVFFFTTVFAKHLSI